MMHCDRQRPQLSKSYGTEQTFMKANSKLEFQEIIKLFRESLNLSSLEVTLILAANRNISLEAQIRISQNLVADHI